ncbi:lysozyme inhibitor LprI family protein [Lysobacter changpingensis]|uniref:lysozyme inhibitor LprI family protein n=1 Tax=Lysobacter changpingensis TaxID=2792784 RepID=UPI001A8DEAED|nr:lysozyme inhibitor LprI family protein [Lysobacter changpingensis]
MDNLLYLALGAALTWAFYFVQRRVEKRSAVEAIERNQKLLDLKQGLDESNTNLDDLRHFEQRLIGKAETAARIADNYFTKAEEVARQSDDAAVTQRDMNQQALEEFHRADARLATVVTHLRRQLDDETLAVFDDAHRSWLQFRDRYARFVSQSYAGGAVRPLIHAVTLESITELWSNELETQLGDESL